MHKLPGYNIEALLHESHRSSILRGRRLSDLRPVIIKILRPDMCSSANIARLGNEYEVLRQRPLPGVLRALDFERRGLAMIMEDEGGIPLPDFLLGRKPGISFLLDILIQMAEIIDALHNRGLLHLDLHPSLFILHPENNRLWLAGCGAASISRQEAIAAGFQGRTTASLAYIAPEQSGLLTGGMDRRSDLYSLGIMGYEIFSARLPFEASDPYQWIRAHVYGHAESPDRFNHHIPPMAAAIIMKLMARNPADRYQTGAGLLADLYECRHRLEAGLPTEFFALGQGEAAATEMTAMRLYGREQEIAVLNESYEMVCRDGRQRLVLVSGAEGVGKTALVNESLQRQASERGLFVHVKFTAGGYELPSGPLFGELRRLVRIILDQGESGNNAAGQWGAGSSDHLTSKMQELAAELETWPGSLKEVLASPEAGKVYPEWESSLIGRQEFGRRFLNAGQQFLQWLPRREHPVVLFLDDLHWADELTLRLLHSVAAGTGTDWLLVVGAFNRRDAEANLALQGFLTALRDDSMPAVTIHLEALSLEDTRSYLAGALAAPEFRVQELSRLLFDMARGNPLHLEILLQHLRYEKQLWFSEERGAWEWHTEAILDATDHEDLHARALKRIFSLPSECRAYLNLAALMGRRFELGVLVLLAGQTVEEIRRTIEPAVKEGLVYMTSDAHDGARVIYEFSHQCIHRASEMMVSNVQKPGLHLQIGRLLLKMQPNQAWKPMEPGVTPALQHLNCARNLLEEQRERWELAGYNLQAAGICLDSGAPEAAWNFYRTGLELLPLNAWKDNPGLTSVLHLEGALTAGMAGHVIAAASLFQEVHANCLEPEDRLRVMRLQMAYYAAGERYAEAVDTGMTALELQGMRLPRHPSRSEAVKESRIIKGRSRDSYIDPRLEREDRDWPDPDENPARRRLLETLAVTAACALRAEPDLYLMLTARLANLSLEDEGSALAAPGYAAAAFVADQIFEGAAAADKLLALALKHPAGRGEAAAWCVTAFTAGALLRPRSGTVRQGLKHLQQSVSQGRDAGMILFPALAYAVWMENAWLEGLALEDLRGICQEARAFAVLHRQPGLLKTSRAYLRLAERLMGPGSCGTGETASGGHSEMTAELELSEDPEAVWRAQFTGMIGHCLLGEWEEARAGMDKIAGSHDAIRFFLAGAEFDFYHALVMAASWEDLDKSGRRAASKAMGDIQKRMEKRAVRSPDYFLIQHLLVEAETARIKGQTSRAEKYFDRAMGAALAGGRHYLAGLAAERAARHHLAIGHDQIAGLYIQEAGQAFRAWGADAKLRQMERAYPGWLDMASEMPVKPAARLFPGE